MSLKAADPGDPDIFSPELYKSEAYTFLQLVVGIIALCLPAAVALINKMSPSIRLIDEVPMKDGGILPSISHYYYSRGGGVFVGALCAMAVFFLAYDFRARPGFEADNRLSNVAALCAALVAWFPTMGDIKDDGAKGVRVVHLSAATVLFVCLAVFSLVHFTKCDEGENYPIPKGIGGRRRAIAWAWKRATSISRPKPDPAEKDPVKRHDATVRYRKNIAHLLFGWAIVVFIVGIAINGFFEGGWMFWLESGAVMVFGASWLVKSDWIPWWQASETTTRKLAIKKARKELMAAYRAEIGEAQPTDSTGRATGGSVPPGAVGARPTPPPSAPAAPQAAREPIPASVAAEEAPPSNASEFESPAKRRGAMRRAKQTVDPAEVLAEAAQEVRAKLSK